MLDYGPPLEVRLKVCASRYVLADEHIFENAVEHFFGSTKK